MPALKSGFLPPARRASTLVLCKRQGFLFGGWREEGYSNELFVVTMSRDVNNSIAFSPAITTGVPPIPRAVSCWRGRSGSHDCSLWRRVGRT